MAEQGHISDVGAAVPLGVWLKGMRERAGVTQAAAALAIASTVTTISRWETGRHPLPAESFLALVQHYRAVDDLRDLLSRQRVTGHTAPAAATTYQVDLSRPLTPAPDPRLGRAKAVKGTPVGGTQKQKPEKGSSDAGERPGKKRRHA